MNYDVNNGMTQDQIMQQNIWDKLNTLNTQMGNFQNAFTGSNIVAPGDDGLMRVEGGINRYGEARPDTVLMRDAEGNLDDRFLQTMSPEYLALQQKGMAEGDTRGAELARQMQGMQDVQQRDVMNAQAQSALTGGMQNLAMRGGAGIGSRERLNRDVGRQLMAGSQGIGRDSRMANLAISQQDEQMKNELLGQVGGVSQKIDEGNISRLQQDIRDQNIAAGNIYSEDMQAYGAQKSAEASSAAACFTAGTEFLMADGTYKNIEDIDLGDNLVDGGKVYFLTKSLTTDLYDYNGDNVTGLHAVLENGKWIRVKDSSFAKKIDGEWIVYCLGNEEHLMISHNAQYSDFFETDRYEELTIDESLEALNEKLD